MLGLVVKFLGGRGVGWGMGRANSGIFIAVVGINGRISVVTNRIKNIIYEDNYLV